MSDIVERLLDFSEGVGTEPICVEAADEIERLRARLAEAERDTARLDYLLTGDNYGSVWRCWDGEQPFRDAIDSHMARLADSATEGEKE